MKDAREVPRFFLLCVEKNAKECIVHSLEKQGGPLSFLRESNVQGAEMPFLPEIP